MLFSNKYMESFLEIIPEKLFNLFASGSANRNLYALALIEIYNKFQETPLITIKKDDVRDNLAAYFVDIEANFIIENEEIVENINYQEIALKIINRFTEAEINILEENMDKYYIKKLNLTEYGIQTAKYLKELKNIGNKTSKISEFSSSIYDIYNTLVKPNEEQLKSPYNLIIKKCYDETLGLNQSLKELHIKIEKMIVDLIKVAYEDDPNAFLQNFTNYINGNFVQEYSRLVNEQNITKYRRIIKNKLVSYRNDKNFIKEAAKDLKNSDKQYENKSLEYMKEKIIEMMIDIETKFEYDYTEIIDNLKDKITTHISIANEGFKYLRNKKRNATRKIDDIYSFLKKLSSEQIRNDNELYLHTRLTHNKIIRENSLRYPNKKIDHNFTSEVEYEKQTKENRDKILEEINTPSKYSLKNMQEYINKLLKDKAIIKSSEIPLNTVEERLMLMSSFMHEKELGCEFIIKKQHIENEERIITDFIIKRK